MKITNGRVFNGSCFAEGDVFINAGLFVEEAAYVDDGAVVDAAGMTVAPGLIDLHFHGAVGIDFCDATPQALSARTMTSPKPQLSI